MFYPGQLLTIPIINKRKKIISDSENLNKKLLSFLNFNDNLFRQNYPRRSLNEVWANRPPPIARDDLKKYHFLIILIALYIEFVLLNVCC